ncbi:MAG: helix-turn-helix domain-containing protein, partial [Roseibium sp.]|uniref:helix-turn-helix domain-containing protein n=1 Tax=Roseibium sp. TaxID=1936156 RepID=UPI002636B841
AQRLIELRGQTPRDDFARTIGLIPGTYANYERGDAEPNGSVLLELVRVHGLNLHWLFTGQGSMLIGGDAAAGDVSVAHIRKIIYNIAYSVAGQGLRRVKQKAFAENFLELFDYLMTLDDYDEKSASRVVEFGAERMKRASGQDDT